MVALLNFNTVFPSTVVTIFSIQRRSGMSRKYARMSPNDGNNLFLRACRRQQDAKHEAEMKAREVEEEAREAELWEDGMNAMRLQRELLLTELELETAESRKRKRAAKQMKAERRLLEAERVQQMEADKRRMEANKRWQTRQEALEEAREEEVAEAIAKGGPDAGDDIRHRQIRSLEQERQKEHRIARQQQLQMSNFTPGCLHNYIRTTTVEGRICTDCEHFEKANADDDGEASDGGESGGEHAYEVETIIKSRENEKSKKIEYFVKWVGYAEEDGTWEPEDNLSDTAAELLADFKAEHVNDGGLSDGGGGVGGDEIMFVKTVALTHAQQAAAKLAAAKTRGDFVDLEDGSSDSNDGDGDHLNADRDDIVFQKQSINANSVHGGLVGCP